MVLLICLGRKLTVNKLVAGHHWSVVVDFARQTAPSMQNHRLNLAHLDWMFLNRLVSACYRPRQCAKRHDVRGPRRLHPNPVPRYPGRWYSLPRSVSPDAATTTTERSIVPVNPSRSAASIPGIAALWKITASSISILRHRSWVFARARRSRCFPVTRCHCRTGTSRSGSHRADMSTMSARPGLQQPAVRQRCLG